MQHSIGSFYAFILQRSDRVRLTVVARSNYEAVKQDVRLRQQLKDQTANTSAGHLH